MKPLPAKLLVRRVVGLALLGLAVLTLALTGGQGGALLLAFGLAVPGVVVAIAGERNE